MPEKSIPKVAIITRTKNRPLLLARAVKSVVDQTLQDALLVIVNDGGDPKIVAAVVAKAKELKGRVTVINNPKSLGMEAASNEAIAQSRSKYIAFLDDDDTWDPKFLEETVTFLENNLQYKGVVTGSELITEEIDKNKVVKKSQQKHGPFSSSITLFELAGSNLYTNNSFVYSREAAEKIGRYDKELPVLGDWEFNIRFVEKYDVAVIDKPLSFYHRREKENKNSADDNSAIEDHLNHTALLKNRLLRKDLASNRLGLGTIAGISGRLNSLSSEVESLRAELADLRGRSDQALLVAKYLQAKVDEYEEEKKQRASNKSLPERARNRVKRTLNREAGR